MSVYLLLVIATLPETAKLSGSNMIISLYNTTCQGSKSPPKMPCFRFENSDMKRKMCYRMNSSIVLDCNLLDNEQCKISQPNDFSYYISSTWSANPQSPRKIRGMVSILQGPENERRATVPWSTCSNYASIFRTINNHDQDVCFDMDQDGFINQKKACVISQNDEFYKVDAAPRWTFALLVIGVVAVTGAVYYWIGTRSHGALMYAKAEAIQGETAAEAGGYERFEGDTGNEDDDDELIAFRGDTAGGDSGGSDDEDPSTFVLS